MQVSLKIQCMYVPPRRCVCEAYFQIQCGIVSAGIRLIQFGIIRQSYRFCCKIKLPSGSFAFYKSSSHHRQSLTHELNGRKIADQLIGHRNSPSQTMSRQFWPRAASTRNKLTVQHNFIKYLRNLK